MGPVVNNTKFTPINKDYHMKILIWSMSIFLLLFASCDSNINNNDANNKAKNVQRQNANQPQNPPVANMNFNEEDEGNEDKNGNDEEQNENDVEIEQVNVQNKNINIPDKWNITDSFTNLPVIDFRKFKSVNNSAVSKAEKEKDKEAR